VHDGIIRLATGSGKYVALFVSVSSKSSPLLGAAKSVSSPEWGLPGLDWGGALSREVSAVSWISLGGAVVAFTAAVATAEGPLAPAKLEVSVLASRDGCCAWSGFIALLAEASAADAPNDVSRSGGL
jgi:hypothetical protein